MPPDRARPLLDWAARRLKAAGCETPELDARLLLQAASGLSREDIILAPEAKVPDAARQRLAVFLDRREGREPVSRILGEREFYGRPFHLTEATLDPRPDTETIIDAALALMPQAASILDLGTGTGAIAVTLLAERPDATGVATDISPAALAVARENAVRAGVAERLTLLQGNWFAPVAGVFDIILSNPPYIPAADIAELSPEVRNFDPALALAGGTDGLDPYRALARGAAAQLAEEGWLLVEIGAGQADAVEAIFAAADFTPWRRHKDLGGHDRCLVFRHAPKTVAFGAS